jgi:hypothetical protein
MTLLTLPNTLVPGAYEDVGDVQENFVATRAIVNGGIDGENLSATTSEYLGLSATNYPRRGDGDTVPGLGAITGTTYTPILRCGPVVMPTAGILHVSLWMPISMVAYTGGTASFALQLNGTTIRSRFGVASAGSGGLMELTATLPTPGGVGTSIPGAVLYTDLVDVGLGILTSSDGLPSNETTFGHPGGAPLPVAVNAGSYVIDLVGKVGTAAGFIATLGPTSAPFAVRAEAY